VDERIPPSLVFFNMATTAQGLYSTWYEPTVASIRGIANGQMLAAMFTLVLWLECDRDTSVWLARHMAGEHLCPREGEGRLFVGFIVYMAFGSYHAHRYKDYLSVGEVKLKLGRVLQECREEAEEKAASGEEPAGIASVLPERSQEVRRRAAALSRDAASLVSD